MDRQRRTRSARIVVASAAVFALTALVPAAASAQGNLVNDLFDGLLGGGGAAAPFAGSPGAYTPPMHGSNPHGQGSVGVIDLTPSNTLPLSGDPRTGDEEVTVGDSRGEQNGGTYHGRIFILHAKVLGLDTAAILPPIETNPGETKTGPAAGLQAVIDTICTGAPPAGLGQAAGCVSVLPMSSSTSGSGSQNSFGVASVNLSGLGAGLTTQAASTNGDISNDSACQTSTGGSTVAAANASLPGLPAISATALQGNTRSQACNNGSQSQTNSSTVANINGAGLALPVAGCANGTPNSAFTALLPLIGTVCNADDSNGGQAAGPYGVREALTVFALVAAGNPLAKVTAAGPESHAVAPPATTGGDDDSPGGGAAGENKGGPGGNNGGGPAATTAQSGNGRLPFTGLQMLVLGIVGGALILGGFGLSLASRRYRRATA